MESIKSGNLVPLFAELRQTISKNSVSRARGERHQIPVKGGLDQKGGLPVIKGGLGTLAETMILLQVLLPDCLSSVIVLIKEISKWAQPRQLLFTHFFL